MKYSTKHKRKTQTILFAFIFTSLLSWSFPAVACGCGLLIMAGEDGWEYGNDTTEQAFISYKDGTEHLLINLDIKTRDMSAVLVVPVPSVPDQVVADILAETPEFTGYNVEERAVENLAIIQRSLLETQLYPNIIRGFTQTFGVTDGAFPGMPNSLGRGVTVFQHLEKEGMVAEVLSAATSDELYTYLTEKGLKVEKDSIPIFRDYIRDDFSFVVAWIDPAKSNVTARGLTMVFPTAEMYYPLKPNSAYSGEGMEKTITVAGYVTPRIYAGITNTTEVSYRYSEEPLSYKDFFNSETGFGFTTITIRADTKSMTEDLYIADSAPLRILYADAINQHVILLGLLLLVLFSYLATLVALKLAAPVAKDSKVVRWRLLVAFNCLTLIGTILSAVNMLATRRFRYIVLFSLSFVTVTVVIMFVMKTPLLGA